MDGSSIVSFANTTKACKRVKMSALPTMLKNIFIEKTLKVMRYWRNMTTCSYTLTC